MTDGAQKLGLFKEHGAHAAETSSQTGWGSGWLRGAGQQSQMELEARCHKLVTAALLLRIS